MWLYDHVYMRIEQCREVYLYMCGVLSYPWRNNEEVMARMNPSIPLLDRGQPYSPWISPQITRHTIYANHVGEK